MDKKTKLFRDLLDNMIKTKVQTKIISIKGDASDFFLDAQKYLSGKCIVRKCPLDGNKILISLGHEFQSKLF